VSPPEREVLWLRRVRDLSQRLAAERDPERLLPAILDAAIEITEAERGFLVRAAPGRRGGLDVTIEAARGFDRAGLERAASSVSRTVVERVLTREEGLVTTSEADADLLEVTSVKARRVRSIACVPLRLRGATLGALYLDHRFARGAFTAGDLPVLSAFADQAALALETARLLGVRDGLPAGLAQVERLRALHDGEEAPAGPAEDVPERFGRLVGRSAPMAALYEEIERAARTDAPALLLGETGSGRELAAREVHARSDRAREPFLVVDCAAGGPELESALFGHRRGARPWAADDRRGAFVLAGKGVALLRDVDALDPELQGRLLTLVRTGEVTPAGGRPRRVACRVLASTAADLPDRVADGAFREDLYYHLDVLRLVVPPLRQRPDDLPLLIAHLLEERRSTLALSTNARDLLAAYGWPANVRELEAELVRLASLDAAEVTSRHLSPAIQEGRGVAAAPGPFAGMTLSEGVAEVERTMVQAALDRCGGNKSRAARQLGIPRTTLYLLLDRHGL